MAETTAGPVSAPAEPPKRSSRRVNALWWLLAAVGVIAAVAWAGSIRQPADATRPLAVEGPADEVARPTLRIGNFNIHSGKGNDGVTDLRRTATVLAAGRCEVVTLNEVSGDFAGNQAATLGERLEMSALFAPTERRWWHDHFGNGVVSHRLLGSPLRLTLPSTRRKGFRNATIFSIHCGDREVTVVATHVDSTIDRERQLDAVCDLFDRLAAPAVLLGDFNSKREDPRIQELLASGTVTDAVTAGAGPESAVLRVDHIFVKGLRVRSAGLIRNDASDHPHVWADLELPSLGEPN